MVFPHPSNPIERPDQLAHWLVAESYMRVMLVAVPEGGHLNRHWWKRVAKEADDELAE